MIVDPAELALAEALPDPAADATARRNVEILARLRATAAGGQANASRAALPALAAGAPRRAARRVGDLRAQRARAWADGVLRARATDERLELPAQAVFRAIGYRGTPLADVPFDSDTRR